MPNSIYTYILCIGFVNEEFVGNNFHKSQGLFTIDTLDCGCDKHLWSMIAIGLTFNTGKKITKVGVNS